MSRDPKKDLKELKKLQGKPAQLAVFASAITPYYIEQYTLQEQALSEIENVIKKVRKADGR